jgi:hypothetical protein
MPGGRDFMGIIARAISWVWRRWGDWQSFIALADLWDTKATSTAVGGGVVTLIGGYLSPLPWFLVWLAALVAAGLISLIYIAVRLFLSRPNEGASQSSRGASWIVVSVVGLMVMGFLIAGSHLYRESRQLAPTVTFTFENDSRYVTRAPSPERNFVSVEVEADKRLLNASPYIVSIHPITDNDNAPPFSVNPLRSNQRLQIGWFDSGPKAWEKRGIIGKDRAVLFNVFDQGPRLALFTNSDSAQLTSVLKNIPPGEYQIRLEVDDDSLPQGASQDFQFKWTGKKDGFSMKKIEK